MQGGDGGGAGGGGGGGGSQSQYGAVPPAATAEMSMTPPPPPVALTATTHMLQGGSDQSKQQQELVEEASPISSRPPATTTVSNLDEFMRLSAAEDDADRAGGVSSGNRWPRQETLALLQIRSEMDTAFQTATLKGPLWEDVSRKLAELGYKRSAKKCKEKFENVHKYYKRTKEGRAGRQDGKSYRFFTQLEALHNTTATATPATTMNVASQPTGAVATAATTTTTQQGLDVAPVSVGIPVPFSSVRNIPPSMSAPSAIGMTSSSMFLPDLSATIAPPPVPAPPTGGAGLGVSFSSDESSSSPSSEEDEGDDTEGQPTNVGVGTSRKRKRRSSSSGGETRQMMEFFEGLMKQVMQKQEAMQQRFLEAIEKREQDRMIREEAWKRQEMARLSREHELMAQERAIASSRDAAIVAFLQKITGQTIHLPSPVNIPVVPQSIPLAPTFTVTIQQPQLQPPPPPRTQQPQPPAPSQQKQDQQQQRQQVSHHHHQTPVSSEIVMAIPQQQGLPQDTGASSESMEPSSSRWPKAEVLALINLRSGLESRYQEAGPKGPLWEEISAGMQRMGYNRNPKRCKEKWENINKYFKKIKENNKKRPEDAKTCPYFRQLDALYRKKVLASGGGSSSATSSGFTVQTRPEEQQHQQEAMKLEPPPSTMPQDRSEVSSVAPAPQSMQPSESNKNGGGATGPATTTGFPGSLFEEGNGGAANKPEDIVKELTNQQGTQQQRPQQQLMLDEMEEADSENMDNEEDEDEEEDYGDEDDDEELQEERKMAYKIEFQRQKTGASNGGGNGATSFLAMVQ